jgi:hypothetical protein
MDVKITRLSDDKVQTLGKLTFGDKSFHTLELPWKNNERKVSCIPAGKYKVIKRNSPKYGTHFHVQNVPGRDLILIHHGNYHTDILGCILVGKGLTDINGDGRKDVTQSKVAMSELIQLLPAEFNLEIIAVPAST